MSWQKVYESPNRLHAEIVKGVLETAGFSPILLDKRNHAYPAMLCGQCEVYVVSGQALHARKLIDDEIRFE